ncbi:MAG: hypothetical protein MUO62_04945 [Anaerolineales bacterium]|nr:hypothetical protein [Anaerolineales bacterium]
MMNTSEKLQPELFDFYDSVPGVAELFPSVWTAAEKLTSADVKERESGLDQLIDLDAHRLSPLIAYLIATCLADPDIEFRYKVVQTIGGLMLRGEKYGIPTERVKQSLKNYLSQMRRRRIFALLQVSEYHPSAESSVVALFKGCSHAGKTLSDIFLDRKIQLEVRRQAIRFSGMVGFLDAVPGLEKLAARLEVRMSGQRSMPFATPIDQHEKSLLPTVQTALAILNFP